MLHLCLNIADAYSAESDAMSKKLISVTEAAYENWERKGKHMANILPFR